MLRLPVAGIEAGRARVRGIVSGSHRLALVPNTASAEDVLLGMISASASSCSTPLTAIPLGASKIDPAMIRAVLFDLDGTLFDRATTVQRCVAAQFHRFRALFSDIAEPLYVARFIELDQRGYVPKDEVYRQLADELRLPDQADILLFDDFYEHFHRHAVAYPGVSEVLESLRSNGLALGIITNGGASHQQATISALQIGSFFSSILISEAEGLRKPDERIFLRGLEHLGVSPSKAVFVGDHPEVDVEGARAAGLWSVWRRDEYWGECRSAHAKIEDLDSLPTLLAQGPWVSPPSSAPNTAVQRTGSFS